MPRCFARITASSASSEIGLAVDPGVRFGNHQPPQRLAAQVLEASPFQLFENQYRMHRPAQHRRGQAGMRRTVRQWTGLPVGVGIAETRTLAKIANRLAKTSARTAGVH